MKALTRSYIQAAQGKIEKMNFESRSGLLSTIIILDTMLFCTKIFALQSGVGVELWYPYGI